MKKIVFLIFFLQSTLSVAQVLELHMITKSKTEQQTIDSLMVKTKFDTEKQLKAEVQNITNQLFRKGFLALELVFNRKLNNQYVYTIDLKKQTTLLVISTKNIVAHNRKILNIETDTLKIPFEKSELFLKNLTFLLEMNGYGTSSVQLVDFFPKSNILYATLQLNTIDKRLINDLKLVGYDKFPKSIKFNISKKYQSKILTSATIEEIYNDFNAFTFIKQLKKPEILLKTDSTHVFVYVEPKSSNTFDGFVGFTTNEKGKVAFTGNLNVALQNIFNSGEKIQLHWQNNGEKRSEIDLTTEIPYLFKSKFSLETHLNITKNDSLFQNTMLAFGTHYLWKPSFKIGLHYTEIQSTPLQKQPSGYPKFIKKYISMGCMYQKNNLSNQLFPQKVFINLQTGWGNRKTSLEKTNQYFVNFQAFYQWELATKHQLFFKNNTYIIRSDNFIVNELPQLGGTQTLRGFADNSLIANQYSTFLTEYQYVLATNLYIHTLTDFGFFNNKIQHTNGTLISYGAGIGLQTSGGIFQLIYAQGKAKTSSTSFVSNIVHIKYSVNF